MVGCACCLCWGGSEEVVAGRSRQHCAHRVIDIMSALADLSTCYPQADVPPPPPEEQQQLVQFIQKQAKLLEQARAIEAQQRATAAKVIFTSRPVARQGSWC